MNPLRTALGTAGWGVYCACSWTWCIGMFLPVILLGRYGWWGFLIFAIPNVIGCAAFGYVLRTRECSQQVVSMHRPAMLIFSLVTIAYHVFFLGFICWLLLPGSEPGAPGEHSLWIALAVPVVVLLLGQVLADVPTRTWPVLAVALYALSLTVFAFLGVQPLTQIEWAGDHTPIDVAWLFPVMLFGFLLCPYLDLTFHRALQESPGRHAFGVFGVTFAVMIVLTCVYWDVLITGLTWLVLAHIMAQTVFTVGAHMREIGVRQSALGNGPSPRPLPIADCRLPTLSTRLLMLAPLIALPIAFLGAFTLDPLAMSLDNYLRFLVFYGLAFPAYVILFMGRSGHGLSQRSLTFYALACVAFLPMYEAGFLHGQAWVLVVPPLVFTLWWTKRRLSCISELPETQETTP